VQFIFSPVQGSLSDHFGRRTVILVSCAGLGLGFHSHGDGAEPLVAAGRQGDIGYYCRKFQHRRGAYSFRDVTPPEKRAASFGLIGVAFGTGFILGPALGGLLGAISPRLPFWASAGMALANVCWGLFVLPESLPKDRRVPFAWEKRQSPGGPQAAAFSSDAHGSSRQLFPLESRARRASQHYGAVTCTIATNWDTRAVGLLLAGVGISSLIVQGFLVKPMVRWLRERRCGGVGVDIRRGGLSPSMVSRPPGRFSGSGVPVMALVGVLHTPSLQPS